MLILDVDHLKAVNDTYGHVAGDGLLEELAGRLSCQLPDGDVLYRVGGDEFAAILLNTSVGEATAIAQRLADAARGLRATVSVGVAMLGAAGADAARRAADEALYRAKAAGRDRVLTAS